MEKVIIHGNIVLENEILFDGAVCISGDTIVKIGKLDAEEIPHSAQVIDAKGAYVGPGFVDIHVHEGGGYSTCFAPKEAARFFLKHGTTAMLATPSYDLNFAELMDAIQCVKEAMPYAPTIKGFYMEGPYMNPKYGSHAYQNPWRHGVEEKEYKEFVDAAGTDAKVWAIAPEREGLLPFLSYIKKVNPKAVIAVGHSEASPDEIYRLGQYRPTLQTHSMCATGRKPAPAGTRGVGPDEYCLIAPDVYCELISDSCGIHVHPQMQRLLLHNKGVHHTVLITDSTIYDEPTPERFKDVPDLNFDAEGGIAGSKLTMELACRNVMTHTGCNMVQAFVMASLNGAKVLGLDHEIGSVAVGKKADLVFVDENFNVQQVMLRGELCNF